MGTSLPKWRQRATKAVARLVGVSLLFTATSVGAVSSLNPTLLVNTEAFFQIDSGDGSSNIEMQFGNTTNYLRFLTTNLFEFSHGIIVNGNTKVRGNLSGSTLRVDGNADVWGTLGASGSIKTRQNLTINSDSDTNNAVLTFGNQTADQTVTYSNSLQRFEFSKATWVNGNLAASGSLSVQNNITTRADLTINADNDTNNAVLTFGNQTAAQNITYNNAQQLFTFSKGIRVAGNMSGQTLTVDGALTLRGQTYNFPTAQVANGFLKTDGAGNLSWTTSLASAGSGGIVSLQPEYPGAVYFASGSTAVGSLAYIYDSTNKENAYRWNSTKTALQDYWMSVRVKVPKNFSAWDPTPIKFRYKTLTTSAADNFITVRLLDTTGANVSLTGASSLTSSVANTWTTANITLTGGTFTAGDYVTVLVKVAAKSTGTANPGYIDLQWKTTTP